MRIKQIRIKQFRCFSQLDLNLDNHVVLLQGENGTGKTTILEAIHYLCYMRSFRTHVPRDLIKFDEDNFFVKIVFSESDQQEAITHDLQVGFDKKRKIVKLNKKNITTFKDLVNFYRIVVLTEDDLNVIKGGPELRRAFLDSALFVLDDTFIDCTRDFKKVLENRNMLLQKDRIGQESYLLWTRQLWEKSRIIQTKRDKLMVNLEKAVNDALKATFKEKIAVKLEHKTKNMSLDAEYEQFEQNLLSLKEQEMRFRRSLFGAHLDDFIINFQGKKSKVFASRGQQKLVVLLLKVAQIIGLTAKRGPAIFLLDDFMTDFDEERASKLANFLPSLNSQIILTSPCRSGFFENLASKLGANKIQLTI